jgi:pimeloyl-ACP methyl ester carboxylesterase
MSTTVERSTLVEPRETRRGRAALAVRRLAAITAAGALLGVLVGGVGGRLAMMLLARLNPQSAGVVSDDGFTMGRFDVVNTLQLLAVGLLLGMFGAGIYALLRGLMIGPRWFQVLSISVGPAVVVGEQLVHTDGVDFVLLQPAGLAIALFVLLPGLYAAGLTLLAERWQRPGSWFLRARLALVAPVLLVWAGTFPLLPLLAVLAVLWLVRDALVRTPAGARLTRSAFGPWLVRAALAVVFVVSGLRLVEDVRVLT